MDERKGGLREQEEGSQGKHKDGEEAEQSEQGKKGKGGEEMQHLRQRNRGEDERFGSFEGNTSQDGK